MKYRLDTNDTITVDSRTLYRIIATKDFGSVNAGEKGGYIESEKNLSHSGNAWVRDKAWVYGYAEVSGNAEVRDNARVVGCAQVSGNAEVRDEACVSGNAVVCGNARVRDEGWIYGDAEVSGNAEVRDEAKVCGDARVCGNAEVYSRARIRGDAWVSGDARVRDDNDYLCVQFITGFREKKGCWRINCGPFSGTVEEFRQEVENTHGNSLVAQEYMLIADLIELRIKHNQSSEAAKK